MTGKREVYYSNQNDVRWHAVFDEDRDNISEDRNSSEPIASFPETLKEGDAEAAEVGPADIVYVTRASVYAEKGIDDACLTQASTGIPKVNSNSQLLGMDRTAEVVPRFEDSGDGHPWNDKMCHGPPLMPVRGISPLTTFALDVENELMNRPGTGEDKFESVNSLDIERELNELMGALRMTGDSLTGGESVPRSVDGSEINLAYVSTESDEDADYNTGSRYWVAQRAKSLSFVENRRFPRNSSQRISMFEFGARNRTGRTASKACVKPQLQTSTRLDPLCLHAEHDRSSVVEPRVTSLVSLPPRPQSAEDVVPNTTLTLQSRGSSPTPKMSGSFDDVIDWTWLEEAMRNLNIDAEDKVVAQSSSLRVDAGCQTQSEQSWPGEEGRMRSGASSERDPPTASCVTSECRAIEISGSCDEDMSSKSVVESSGPSGVSSWLRQSMRRVRHFNLGEPPRIRSAPPDSLRQNPGNSASDSVVNVSDANGDRVINDHANQQPRQQQQGNPRARSAGTRQQRCPSRARTARRPVSAPAPTQTQLVDVGATAPSEAQEDVGYESDSTDRHPSPRGRGRRHEDEGNEDCEGRSPLGPWPHGLSSVLAGLGCTLGLFNISRFAILSVHFGSNFILQFLILSLILGVPLLAFHAALGQTLGAGPVDMWKISPLFQGIGIALLLSQALVGVYSVVGVSWMFVYFRDSFITKQDSFRWAESFRHYREDHIYGTTGPNTSGRLEETVPDYLNGVVLQRYVLATPDNAFGHLKFHLTFNLAVIWMIVFVSLSKGLRSYGKVVYVFSLVPVLGILVMSSKLLGLTPLHRGLFPQTDWSEFFLNAKSWISAATEVTLTWNLLGAATMQVTSHNRTRKKLWRDVATITLLTMMVLILAAFLGNTCHQILSLKGYSYIPSSFERMWNYSFLRQTGSNLPPPYALPVRHMPHASLVAGERVGKLGIIQESGYQVVRLATELVPATLALLGGEYLSPFWAVLFYFTLILFGIAQQLAIWHCVITGIMAINAPSLKSWETTITFFTCAAGFILGLPMTTEFGVFVVYFLDYCVGGGWWVLLLTIIEICAVLMVRGRPYTGENISVALFGKSTNCISLWAIPVLTFSWNVIMPVSLLVVCITIFKTGGYRDLWIWRCGKADYWPLWTREVGVFVQVIPLVCIPLVALIQAYRYLTSGPPDIFDRIANLYRPNTDMNGILNEENAANATNASPTAPSATGNDLTSAEDPPPKYTPPPSYSTATGARIAKMLRQSIRRSVRRIQSVLGSDLQSPRPPPPDYASVLVEINQDRNLPRPETIHGSDSHNFTAADVVQVLRCSFRQTDVNRNTSPAATHTLVNSHR